MKQESHFVGIDVSKAQLDVAVCPTAERAEERTERWKVSNDDTGIDRLVNRLRELQPARIVLEATGGMEVPASVAPWP